MMMLPNWLYMQTSRTGLENTESFLPRIRININTINSKSVYTPVGNIEERMRDEMEWICGRNEWLERDGRKEL